jgi:hypothetical protein
MCSDILGRNVLELRQQGRPGALAETPHPDSRMDKNMASSSYTRAEQDGSSTAGEMTPAAWCSEQEPYEIPTPRVTEENRSREDGGGRGAGRCVG